MFKIIIQIGKSFAQMELPYIFLFPFDNLNDVTFIVYTMTILFIHVWKVLSVFLYRLVDVNAKQYENKNVEY